MSVVALRAVWPAAGSAGRRRWRAPGYSLLDLEAGSRGTRSRDFAATFVSRYTPGMPSERVQRQIDRLLDQAEEAIALRQWEDLRATCGTLLSLDPDNSDAARYLILANDSLATDVVSDSSDVAEPSQDRILESDEYGNVYESSIKIKERDDIDSGPEKDLRDFFKQLFGTKGRINRSGYVLRAACANVATVVMLGWMFEILRGAALENSSDFPEAVGFLFSMWLFIALLAITFCAMVRRFHDFNWGGARVLLLFIPFVNIVIAFMLLFRSGTRGTNDHGNEPVDLAVGF